MVMNKNNKERRFRRLLYTTALYTYSGSSHEVLTNELERQMIASRKFSERHPYWIYYGVERYEKKIKQMKGWDKSVQKLARHIIIKIGKLLECLKLGIELDYTEEEIHVLQHEQFLIRYKKREQERPMPKETRDNKDVHVGGGGSNNCKVRYPSKKRSRRTWSNFYKLFPGHAERDNWNGKISDRMK